MKKTTLYIALLTGAFGVLALSPKLSAADEAMSSMSCCSKMAMTTPMASDASTNGVPDLLTTCPVSGEKLGEMGKPLVFSYKDQEVKLCCKSCKKDFDKEPAKYMKLIRAADKKQP